MRYVLKVQNLFNLSNLKFIIFLKFYKKILVLGQRCDQII